jgi:hypothetical protein
MLGLVAARDKLLTLLFTGTFSKLSFLQLARDMIQVITNAFTVL